MVSLKIGQLSVVHKPLSIESLAFKVYYGCMEKNYNNMDGLAGIILKNY